MSDNLLTVISDTHGQHAKLIIPETKWLVHCGDSTMNGTEGELLRFLDWFADRPAEFKMFISGNHDWICQRSSDLVRREAKLRGIIYLEDEETLSLGRLRFYGSPWQPYFGGWAFNFSGSTERCSDQYDAEAVACWKLIPDDVDVVITHGPAYGLVDLVDNHYNVDRHVGCKHLRDRLVQVKPMLHLCGHIHCGYGETRIPGIRTIFVNASSLGEDYRTPNDPRVYDMTESFGV